MEHFSFQELTCVAHQFLQFLGRVTADVAAAVVGALVVAAAVVGAAVVAAGMVATVKAAVVIIFIVQVSKCSQFCIPPYLGLGLHGLDAKR